LDFRQLDYRGTHGANHVLSARNRAEVHARQSERNGGELMDKFINVKLLSHPLNWLTIFLMLVIAAIAGHEVLSLAKIEPTTDGT
jgi:hypothetical protein